MTEITPADLDALLTGSDDEDVLVIDVRTRPEFEISHIPGSVNIPFLELTDSIGDRCIPATVVLVCEVGVASEQAARLVEAYEGVGSDTTVAHLAGGIREWDGPLEPPED
ncbi:MAG: rhodanese-like domain-containing protein [Halanaeroarchaeum sp.]